VLCQGHNVATRRTCGILVLVLVLVLLTTCSISHVEAQDTQPRLINLCPFEGGIRKQIGPDSIGQLPLWLNLATLRRLCPNARDTTVSGLEGPGSRTYPGVVLTDGALNAIALQFGNDSVDAMRPADGWIAEGKGADLPSHVPIEATWGEIYRKYPVAQAQAGSVLIVRFCGFSSALVTFQVASRSVPVVDGRVDLARIPPTATIHHVFILSKTLARGLGACP
jgi:hypothetical protein